VIRSLALALTLMASLALAWLDIRVPAPAGPDAPATAYSEARALKDVEVLGQAPHPIDSLRHDQVRDYLIGRLKDLGLEVRVQNARAFHEFDLGGRQIISGADVQNLIGVMPGRNRNAKALAVMAHYDSVPGSPGAADNTAGVVSQLEIARALKAQGQPERDVVFIITDGEENGLVGAHAFYGQDPLAKRIGFVLNMDTRGSGGRTFMFQTGAGDGQTIDLFRRSAVDPRANSLAVFIYEHMPNDTDFTVSRRMGILGLNYAFMGREFDYHSPTATPANNQPGAIQDMGRQVLAAARAVAYAKVLPAKTPDKVFGDLFGKVVIAYPPLLGWLLLVVSIVFTTAAVLRERKKGEIGWIETIRAYSAALALLFFLSALASFVRDATLVPRGFVDQLPLLARFGWFEAALGFTMLGGVLLGIGALMQGQRRLWALIVPIVLGAACYLIGRDLIGAGAAVGAALFATPAFGRPVRPWSVVGAFLKLALLIALIAQAFAPSAAFMIEWPLLLITTGVLIASFAGGLDRPVALLACGIAAVLCLGWALGEIHMLTLGVGADLPAALGLFFWTAALAIVPLIAVTPRPISLSVFAFTAAIVTLGVIVFDTPPTARYPRATEVMYVHDADTDRYYRTDLLQTLDPWTEQALKADSGKVRKRSLFPLAQDPVFVADATGNVTARTPPPHFTCHAPNGCSDPVIHLVNAPYESLQPQLEAQDIQSVAGGDRHVLIDLWFGGENRRVILAVKSDRPFKASLFGTPLSKPTKAGKWLTVVWAQPPLPPGLLWIGGSQGLSLVLPHGAKLEVRYAAVVPGWPKDAKPLPPRPGNVMAYSSSDSTAEVGTFKIEQ
jgi:hypothetical protein